MVFEHLKVIVVRINMADSRQDSCNTCKYCKKTVLKNQTKCTICDSTYHPSCSERTNRNESSSDFICCFPNKENGKEVFPPKSGQSHWFQEIIQSKEQIIKAKDELMQSKNQVITCLLEQNKLLQDKITELTSKLNTKQHEIGNKANDKQAVKKQYQHTTESQYQPLSTNQTYNSSNTNQLTGTNEINNNEDDRLNKQTENSIDLTTERTETQKLLSSIINITADQQNTKEEWKTVLGKYKKKNTSSNIESKNEINTKETSTQENRRIKRYKQKIFIGKATQEENEGFSGKTDEKKIWLYVSKVKEHVTEDKIKKYISNKTNCSEEDISIKNLDIGQQQYKSFMVGLNTTLKDQVYDENFWPAGVCFARFNFSLGKRFLDNRSRNQSTQSEKSYQTL